jgi:hypothetical protein
MSEPRDARSTTPLAGRVGVFWVHGVELIAFSVALVDGEDDGLFINGPFDHVTVWPQAQRAHPKLRALDYEQVPRGRVLFAHDASVFRVFLDQVIRSSDIQAAILERFELARDHAVFLRDPHYTTDPNALDEMFGFRT